MEARMCFAKIKTHSGFHDLFLNHTTPFRGRRGHDRMVVGFNTTYAIYAYSYEFYPCSWRGVLDTTFCDKVCQWFSPCTPVSSTNKTNRHDITEILLKVELNTLHQPTNHYAL